MRVVKLSSGSLAVFSPIALTPSVKSKLSSLGGEVSYIAALDLEHHIFLSSWAAAFPKAHIIAPEGLAEKRAQQNAKDKSVTILNFSTIFKKADKDKTSISEEFDRDFEYEYVDSHQNKELVFFHKPSKTLIEADLLFNLPAIEQYSKTGESATDGFLTRLFGGLQHTRGTAVWQKRLVWYAFSSGDRAAFGRSMKRINGWGFENLIPCHGDVILGDGKAIFEKIFEWQLQGKH